VQEVTLAWGLGQKPRHTRDGEVRHYDCPFCFGKLKLGVWGTNRYNCFKCGATYRTREVPISIFGTTAPPPVRPPRREEPRVPFPRAIGPVKDALAAEILRRWNVPLNKVIDAGVQVIPHYTDRLALPYRNFGGEEGYVLRRFDSEPKAITMGPPGPGLLPAWGAPGSPIAVVEGWMDGAAIPLPYCPVMLLGTGGPQTWQKLTMFESPLYLCMDNDHAGKEAEQKLARAAWKCGVPAYGVRYPGKDPADCGPCIRDSLQAAQPFTSLREIEEWYGEWFRQHPRQEM